MSNNELSKPSNSNILAFRYEIERQIARKSGRRTLLARDRETGELVVVKLLSFASDFEWDALKLFEREAKILQAISHPTIPRYLDYCELDFNNGNKGFALVQTYIPAKSLADHLKSGRSFDEVEIKQLAKAVLEILIYLHGRQPPVIHRDIKPSNILLSDRSGNSIGQVYLVDFGSVQTLAAKEGGTMTIVGTYGYMPPEQFGDRTVPASDLYSFGTTLVYLVTGTHPADLPQKDGRIQFESLINLSLEFTQWLRRMVEPSLDRRFTSAEKALQELIQPQSVDENIVLPIAKQPSSDKVKFTRRIDGLEILLPVKRWSTYAEYEYAENEIVTLIFLGVVHAVCTISLLYLLVQYRWFISVFFGYLWYEYYGLASSVINRLFNRTKLKISEKKFTLIDGIFGLKGRKVLKGDKRKVELFLHRKNYENYGCSGIYNIVISVGINLHSLRYDSELTDLEMEWLAQELSAGLNRDS